jgi:hypothetical protein
LIDGDSQPYMNLALNVVERFWAKVDTASDCWAWLGYLSEGYGTFHVAGRPIPAHRFAYQLIVGPIPQGLQLDHLCRNRRCVNPAHLEPVTRRVNILRGESPTALNAAKTHCDHGHELVGANVYVTYRGRRHCRACHREEERARRARLRVVESVAVDCPQPSGQLALLSLDGARS